MDLKLKYDSYLLSETQSVVQMRKMLRIKQSNMAHLCGVSLKTIQNFEAFKILNPFLVFAYKQIIREHGNNTIRS
jgi:DNA-binding XRE family transcriptional regulator